MELVFRLPSGATIPIGIQPGDTVELPHDFPAGTSVTLVPDCEEEDYGRNGDCTGSSSEFEVLDPGAFGKRRGDHVHLCGGHSRQASRRKQIQRV